MDKIDLRKLNNDELYAVRKQVVRLKKQKVKQREIEELVGIHQSRITEIWKNYRRDGLKGIKPKTSGRKAKSQMILSSDEQKEIRAMLTSTPPNQLKLAGYLWTLSKISSYIWTTYRKRVSNRTLSNYMERWGLTCQRPTKRACGQDIVRIQKFMNEEYPAILKRAKAENADIYWGDETGISNKENFERGFSEKGTPPVLPVCTKQEKINMISAINNKGSVRFMIYEQSMNQDLLIDFFRRLIRETPRKVFVILDNLRVHHGKKVVSWVEKHKKDIELFFLPPYAPEYNPDEYLNHSLKRNVHSGELPKTKKDIKSKTQSFMRKLQHDKRKVQAFFNHKKLAYCCVQE